jgi:hypothetical protein
MSKRELPSPELLRQLLRYEPKTGKLYWLPRCSDTKGRRTFNARFAHKEAFKKIDKDGYKRGCVNGSEYMAHRVIWAMCFGEWPEAEVDHIDNNASNNIIDNLRLAGRYQNAKNRRSQKNSASIYKGVYRARSGWRAIITANGNRKYIGRFLTEIEAAKAYDAQAMQLHGEFAFTNFK